MTLSARLAASIKADQSIDTTLSTGLAKIVAGLTIDLANGTGAGQGDRLWSATRTIAASGTDDLDLAGPLIDAFGAAVTFAKVKGLLVVAAAGNTNNVVVGGATPGSQFASWLGSATDKVVLRPDTVLLLGTRGAAGYAVTPTTGDVLRVANSGAGTPVTYDIVIIGASA